MLTNLSKALHRLEKVENPVDEKAQREAFDKAIQPSLKVLQEAIQSGDKTTMEATLKILSPFGKKVNYLYGNKILPLTEKLKHKPPSFGFLLRR